MGALEVSRVVSMFWMVFLNILIDRLNDFLYYNDKI